MNHIFSFLFHKTGYLLITSFIVVLINIFYQPSNALSNDDDNSNNKKKFSAWCNVNKVIDGDTVNISCSPQSSINFIINKKRLRLLHIDAPEMTQKPWGKQSKDALAKIIGQKIWVEFNGKDIYNRYLGTIYNHKDDTPINLQLVNRGAARVYKKYKPPHSYLQAMHSAKKKHLGIWKSKGLHQNPARYRRLSH